MSKTMKTTCSSCGDKKFPGEIRNVDAGNGTSRPVCVSCIETALKPLIKCDECGVYYKRINTSTRKGIGTFCHGCREAKEAAPCDRCGVAFEKKDLFKYVLPAPGGVAAAHMIVCASCRKSISEDRPVENAAHTGNKYKRTFKGVTLDVYDTIELWAVTCPARQHAIKKLLCAGIRGKNDTLEDLKECRDALTRAIELQILRESGDDER